jgi:protoheme IX farnesyltransferase
MQQTRSIHIFDFIKGRLRDYAQLTKVTLSMWIVFSAVFGFVFVAENITFIQVLYLALGGFFITGASNTLNQIFEIDTDKLMKRTAQRPLPTERMTSMEALLWAGVQAILGTMLLWLKFNGLAAFLGLISLISYAMVYTPMKRVSSMAVFIGAVPGALPPMIGAVAAQGFLSFEAVLLFFIQFFWQFPHFWAIGWIGFNDYKNAGFHLLPSKIGKDSHTAIYSILYACVTVLMSVLPVYFGIINVYFIFPILLLGFFFVYKSLQLLRLQTDVSARSLMFASIIYIPLLQIVLIISKLCN